MRIFFGSFIALSLASAVASAGQTEIKTYDPCEAVDQAAYDAFEPGLSVREPRLDSFGFRGEVRGPKDGLQFIQPQLGGAVAWFDGPAKAKLIRKETGETLFFISKVSAERSESLNSLRLILSEGKIECGWPAELR